MRPPGRLTRVARLVKARAITVILSWEPPRHDIGILVLVAIIWLLIVLLGGVPTWLLLLLIILVVISFVGGRGRAV